MNLSLQYKDEGRPLNSVGRVINTSEGGRKLGKGVVSSRRCFSHALANRKGPLQDAATGVCEGSRDVLAPLVQNVNLTRYQSHVRNIVTYKTAWISLNDRYAVANI